MTATTFYLSSTVAASSNHLSLVTSAPGTATISTGWTVGTTAPTAYSAMNAGTERASSTFGTTALPDGTGPSNTLGDCFRSSSTLDGRWAAGTWTLSVPMIAVTTGGAADVAAVFRVWRGEDPTGSDAVEVTSGIQTGSTLTDLTTAQQISTLAFSLSGVGVVGEYLFLQVALKIVGAGGGATDDALLRVGSAATLVTPNWVPADLTLYDVVLGGQGYRIQWDGYQRGRAQTQPPTINTDANAIPNTLNGVTFSQTAWQGGTGSSATSSGNNTLSSAPGLDLTGTTGGLKVGPAIITSLATSTSPAIVGFGVRGSNLFAAGSDGQLYESTAQDVWTTRGASVGSLGGLTGGTYGVNTATNADVILAVSTATGTVRRWNGAAFSTIGDVGNVGSKRPLAGIYCISTGGQYVPTAFNSNDMNTALATASPAIIGKTASGGIVCAALNRGAAGDKARTETNFAWYSSGRTYANNTATGDPIRVEWYGTYFQSSGIPTSWRPTIITGYTDPVGINVIVSSSSVLYFLANKSTPNGAIYYETYVAGNVSGGVKGLPTSGPSLTDAYPVAAAVLNSTAYLVDSQGRLYTIGAAAASFPLTQVATGLTRGYGPPSDFRAYDSALWTGFQANTKIMYTRYGPSSAGGANVISEPIYGASVSATSSGLFNNAYQFGTNFYLGVTNGASTPIYRADHSRYTTDAVSGVSVAYTGGVDGTNKRFKSLKVQHEALASGDSITVAFQVDGSGSWTAAGTNSAVGSVSHTFTFAGITTGNSIQIKVTLISGSTSTTPHVTSWTFDSTAQQNFVREWKIGLRLEHASGYPLGLRDGSADPQTGAAISAINWTLFEGSETLRYRDIDGTVYDVEIWDYNEKLAPGQPQVFGYQIAGDLTIRELA